MVKEGLVKIDRLNARSLRYILTSQGIKKKALLNYKFAKSSYQYIRGITLSLEKVIKEKNQKGLEEVFLVGEKDDIAENCGDTFLVFKRGQEHVFRE